MASQEQIQLRLKKMLDLFDENPDGIKKDELCLRLGVKIRNAEGMKNTLCQNGYKIKTQGKGVGVWWRDKSEEDDALMTEETSTHLHAEAAIYLYLIKTSPESYTKDGLFQKMRSLDISLEEEKKKLYSSQSDKYNKIIKILQEEGLINLVKHKDGKEYVELSKDASVCIPVFSSLFDEDFQKDAYELLDYLQYYSGGIDNNLISVKSKLELLLDGEIREHICGYEVRGRHSDTSTIADDISSCLAKSSYRHNAVHIRYRDRKNMVYNYNFKVGLIYYSKVQNNIYMLGEELDTGDIFNLRLSGVESVKKISVSNDIYLSSKYLDIFDKMFGASYEREEYDVEVLFDMFGSVPEKIRQLHSSRLHYSMLEEDNGKLVYTDKIIGLSEFAAFLRQFGKSCEVKKPQALRDEMAKSPERVLKRYKDEGII
ncbi:MAG: WYL domain-containing protein [Lachnospiraceae bacterium]|nr:WYL domain-containing protein [Lachnospiraceae bacterium]